MVAVKSHEADTFLAALPKIISAILVYGNDDGMIAERAAAACKSFARATSPEGEILRLDETDLEQDSGRVVTELTTFSMFGGRRIVRATASRRLNVNIVAPLLDSPLEGALVIEAGNLKADEGLRGLFEKSRTAAAIACFPDEARDLDKVIREILGPLRLDITQEARQALIARLGSDRVQSRSEIEKLALYAYGRPRIELADIEAVTGSAGEQTLEAIVAMAASGLDTAALVASGRAYAAGESPQAVIIVAQRYFQRLHRVRTALDATGSLDQALRSLRPPLHFKSRDAFVRQVQAWPEAKLRRALSRIDKAQLDARSSTVEEAVCADAMLLEIARQADRPATAGQRPVRHPN